MDIDDKVLLEHLVLLGKATNEDHLIAVHDFYARQAAKIAAFIRGKGLVSLPIVANYDLFQPLLPLHLLMSNHTALRLPPGGIKNGYWVKTRHWRSSYDDMGCDYESMLNFGDEDTVRNFINHAKPLLQLGVLSLIPSNSVTDLKGLGAPERVDYGELLKTPEVTNTVNNPGDFKVGAALVHEIIMPIIFGARSTDFLKLVTDEWESFQRCRERLIYASVQIGNTTSPLERDLLFKKLNRGIIDEGVGELNDELKRLNRKGIIKAAGGILGSASLFLVNLTCSSALGLLNSAVAAAILGTTNCLNYMEYKEGMNGIKSNPFYFLWKLTRKE